MYSLPKAISVCLDNHFFKDVMCHDSQCSSISVNCILDLIRNNEYVEVLILSGKSLKINEWSSSLTHLNISISWEIENPDYVFDSNTIIPSVYQIRYPVFLQELVGNCRYYKSIFDRISTLGYKFKVAVIYMDRYSLDYIEKLPVIAKELLDMGIMICVFPLPYFFLKEDNRIRKKDFWRIAEIVNNIAEELGNKVYGDFPVGSTKPKNIAVLSPRNGSMLSVLPDGTFSPCRFSKLNLGNIIESSLFSVLKKWEETRNTNNEFCSKCNDYSICRSGCVANWDESQNTDYYCLHLNCI